MHQYFWKEHFRIVLVVYSRHVCSSADGGKLLTSTNRQTLLDCQRTLRISKCEFSISKLATRNSQLHRGAEGIRTLDPLVANQVLSQLSYSPVARCILSSRLAVGLSGVEPLTSRLSGVRSNQLSYRPRDKKNVCTA